MLSEGGTAKSGREVADASKRTISRKRFLSYRDYPSLPKRKSFHSRCATN